MSFRLNLFRAAYDYPLDSSLNNPAYGMDSVTLNGDKRNGVPKVEEDPCPLYEDLDNLGKLSTLYDRARLNNMTVRTEFIIDPFVDDELYTYMKPVTTHFVSDDSKIDYSPQEAKEPGDYEVPKATNDNPYSYDN